MASAAPLTRQFEKLTLEVPKSAEPKINIRTFSDKIGNVRVFYQMLQMDNSVMVWMGTDARLSKLTMAVPVDLERGAPATVLLGDIMDSTSPVQRLTKRLKKQVYLSMNLPPNDAELERLAERRLYEEIRAHPEWF